ncbi:MAG: universal stress protein [Flavisolibacter sp.]
MNKIIAAFDGLSYSDSTKDFAIELARRSKAHLVGVFLDDFTRQSFSVAEVSRLEGSWSEENYLSLKQKDADLRNTAVASFEEDCRKAGVNYTLHRDRNVALYELLHESIYADLLIINNQETLSRFEEKTPSRFIRDLLSEVQCPVLLVPSIYREIEKNIILYDGTPSSVYAVKMFNYLLPALNNNETDVLTVKSLDESLHLPDKHLMKEFMRRHYPMAEYVIIKGDPEDKILSYLDRQKKTSLVILGAYKRDRISRWFRPSMADTLASHIKLPLFIAHSK